MPSSCALRARPCLAADRRALTPAEAPCCSTEGAPSKRLALALLTSCSYHHPQQEPPGLFPTLRASAGNAFLKPGRPNTPPGQAPRLRLSAPVPAAGGCRGGPTAPRPDPIQVKVAGPSRAEPGWAEPNRAEPSRGGDAAIAPPHAAGSAARALSSSSSSSSRGGGGGGSAMQQHFSLADCEVVGFDLDHTLCRYHLPQSERVSAARLGAARPGLGAGAKGRAAGRGAGGAPLRARGAPRCRWRCPRGELEGEQAGKRRAGWPAASSAGLCPSEEDTAMPCGLEAVPLESPPARRGADMKLEPLGSVRRCCRQR